MLAANQLTEAQLAARYDLVVHLTTAADGAAAFYGRETNAARNETPEEARELDARIHANWTRAHPKVVTLSNQGVDFEVKCKACVEAVVRSVDEKFGRAPANKPAFDPGLYTDAVTELLPGSALQLRLALYLRHDGQTHPHREEIAQVPPAYLCEGRALSRLTASS